MIHDTPNIELWYFTGKTCSVCVSLKPKVIQLINKNYPEVSLKIIDIEEKPETAASHMVFTLPVIIIKIDGKEQSRYARSFSVSEIDKNLSRLVELMK